MYRLCILGAAHDPTQVKRPTWEGGVRGRPSGLCGGTKCCFSCGDRPPMARTVQDAWARAVRRQPCHPTKRRPIPTRRIPTGRTPTQHCLDGPACLKQPLRTGCWAEPICVIPRVRASPSLRRSCGTCPYPNRHPTRTRRQHAHRHTRDLACPGRLRLGLWAQSGLSR